MCNIHVGVRRPVCGKKQRRTIYILYILYIKRLQLNIKSHITVYCNPKLCSKLHLGMVWMYASPPADSKSDSGDANIQIKSRSSLVV